MFPSKDLPAIVNHDDAVSNESNNANETSEKHVFSETLCSVILILLIIAIAILIGLLSIFIPKSNDNTSVLPTAETVVLILVLPITQNSSKVISLNNNPLLVNHYLNSAQRNVLQNCLQRQLDINNTTKSMVILSINASRAQYSGNNSSAMKKRSTSRRRRFRRQTSIFADQVEFTISIQCSPFISKTYCQRAIESVLDNGQPLRCILTDEIITAFSPSTTIKSVVATIRNWRQVGQLFLAFGLTSLMGLERHCRGKSAGLRTHSIVGTSSALILQVSKYGFNDVLYSGMVVLDPSRIAAQIVSGISFLGAGLIIARNKAIRGLTSAASVWEAAAIGMAAGSGLWAIALVVTGLHFIILLGFSPLEDRIPVLNYNSPLHATDDGDDSDSRSV